MKNNEIYNKIKELEEKYEKQQEVLDFLIKNDKEGVEIKIIHGFVYSYKQLKYLYGGKVRTIVWGNSFDIEILKTTPQEIIFKNIGKYFKIDKEKQVWLEIPEPLFVSQEKEKEKTKAKKDKNANT